MTVRELMKRLNELFPQHFRGQEHLDAWTDQYRAVLNNFQGPTLGAAFERVIASHTRHNPPTPADLMAACGEIPAITDGSGALIGIAKIHFDRIVAWWQNPDHPWLTSVLGPAPCDPGCRLSPEALERFRERYGVDRGADESGRPMRVIADPRPAPRLSDRYRDAIAKPATDWTNADLDAVLASELGPQGHDWTPTPLAAAVCPDHPQHIRWRTEARGVLAKHGLPAARWTTIRVADAPGGWVHAGSPVAAAVSGRKPAPVEHGTSCGGQNAV